MKNNLIERGKKDYFVKNKFLIIAHKTIKNKMGGKWESKDLISWIIREDLDNDNNEIRVNLIINQGIQLVTYYMD